MSPPSQFHFTLQVINYTLVVLFLAKSLVDEYLRAPQQLCHRWFSLLTIQRPILYWWVWLQLDKENAALTNVTHISPPVASDSQLSTDSELDASMIVDKMQYLKARLRCATDKLEKPLDICGNDYCYYYFHLEAIYYRWTWVSWLSLRSCSSTCSRENLCELMIQSILFATQSVKARIGIFKSHKVVCLHIWGIRKAHNVYLWHFLGNFQLKSLENRFAFVKVMSKSCVSCFYWVTLYLLLLDTLICHWYWTSLLLGQVMIFYLYTCKLQLQITVLSIMSCLL